MEDRTFYLSLPDARLRVRAITPTGADLDNGPVLVFLHEGLGCIEIWRDFPMALVAATGLPAVIYDRQGSGGSDPLPGPRRESHFRREAEEFLPGVLAACGVNRPLLVGHSDGGTIALYFAAAFPGRAVGVITEAAHVMVEEKTLAGIRQTVRAFESGGLREKLARYHGGNTDSMFHGWADIWLDQSHEDWNMEALLSAITCPVLVLQGEDDEYGSIAQVRAICEGVSGRSKSVVLPGCAHVPHHQAREAVLAEMARFVAYLTR